MGASLPLERKLGTDKGIFFILQNVQVIAFVQIHVNMEGVLTGIGLLVDASPLLVVNLEIELHIGRTVVIS